MLSSVEGNLNTPMHEQGRLCCQVGHDRYGSKQRSASICMLVLFITKDRRLLACELSSSFMSMCVQLLQNLTQ